MDNIEELLKNPSKSETYDDVEKTIANQMYRFTIGMRGTTDPVETLKMLCALGMDLWKTCGKRVCEDTNLTLVSIIREFNYEMANQFQQIANGCNNNDICVYLYLALPTINNKVDEQSLRGLCFETIDKIKKSYDKVGHMTNFKTINTDNVKSLYNDYMNK